MPYVGSGVLGSALQMDKEVASGCSRRPGIPVLPWRRACARTTLARDPQAASSSASRDELGLPVFVKPANSGSSVGIHKVKTREALLARARRRRAATTPSSLVERAIDAREIEVAVLGNDEPEASVPGEIRTQPRVLRLRGQVRRRAHRAARARADSARRRRRSCATSRSAPSARSRATASRASTSSFDRKTPARFYVNELNSLPGFTEVSMYPRLWEATGLPYPRCSTA